MEGIFSSLDEFGPMVVIAGAVVACLCLLFAFADATDGPAKRKRARLHGVRDRWKGGVPVAQAASVSLKRDTAYSRHDSIDRLIRQVMPRPEKLRQQLVRTGVRISLATYIMVSIALAICVAAFVVFWFGLSPAIGFLAGLTIGLGIPYFSVTSLVARRQSKFLELFPDAIDLICRGLKSGLPITEALVIVGQEMKDPVGIEFRMVAQAIRLGQTPEEAVWQAAERVGVSELKFFVTALSVQRETGGNLTETLGNLADVLRKRRQMKLKVKAMSSEAKASAMIIGSLPFIMFGIIYLVNSGYVMMLFHDPRGLVMVGMGFALMLTGAVVMVKMVRFEI